ncbi:chromosome segregation protein SMC [Fervidibacillus halotolerans]|uniref:Chromosome partition protein Smc n=1 Tax=Fervidibacillus halotolerans TaxID=2980027 RepID=A0A9E8S1L2_9BACI|nr:chromosome segregation protein SMC [Fervidibacillus halotolerans]WAA13637.1 chromosome segregation protein SMC [Fervidibacillus halotolerans]
MYLKKLEIVGFKSFAEKISIDFDKGLTAVVGPNGSGKSNITDAIRWVLGEQSVKSLRGGKMEDIIFAGSDTRKPLNFAEVSLTLDNEDHFLPLDYQEICITRRIDRSGESEFFINKQPCRLKDIVDLFMDSGLGREAFSIISQGKVEEILNSKAVERRSIFEEAAGVLKYKTRKRKAESKLEETEDNLNRVKDILHELENQLEPLAAQASIAKDYLEKKEELNNHEISIIVYEIEQLHARWEKQKKNVEKHTDEEGRLAAVIQKKEAEIQQFRNELAAIDESVEQLQKLLLTTSEELEKLEGKKGVIKERKRNAKQQLQGIDQQIAEDMEKLSQLQRETEKIAEQRSHLLQTIERDRKLLSEKSQALQLFQGDIEKKIETLKSEYIDLLNDQATIKNEDQHIRNQLEQLANRRDRLLKENEQILVERKKVKDRIHSVEEQIKEVQQVLEQLASARLERERNLERLEKEYKRAEQNYYKTLQFVQQAKNRKELLEELEEDFSGFFRGVKEVLKVRNQLSGVEGAIAELIRVDEPFQTAIEIALSSAMQHIVVKTEEDARKAISYLKKNGFGRATFLPLSVIRGKALPESIEKIVRDHPSFVGVASDIVSIDPKYHHIIKNLLGNVIISKDLKGANDIAKQIQYRYRIVTLDGDVVHAGGSMTGGATKQKGGSFLARKTELETLRKKLSEMDATVTKLERDMKRKKEMIHNQKNEFQKMDDHRDSLQKQLQNLKDQRKDLYWQEKNIDERLVIFDREEKSLAEEKQELEKRANQNQEQLENIQLTIQQTEEEIATLSERQNMKESEKTDLMEMIHQLKVDLAKKEEKLNHLQEQLNTFQQRQIELKERMERNQREREEYLHVIASNDKEEIHIEQKAKETLIDKEKTLELISERRKTRLELQHLLEDLEGETKGLKKQHKDLTELLTDEQVKLNRLDVDLDNRLVKLREEYFLSFEGAKQSYPLSIPYEEAKKKVMLIKRAIDELGTVNLGAIDEYERVKERYEFLMEQKKDLQDAKDTLYQIIAEMDEEMVRRFQETFSAIRDEFNDVFCSLFGGGRADLTLTDPEDLLNTGVEIIAQPPGKKLQNLALLSGGERALTAIALLFSILRVRPVPFCVLDEVEAALDEANVYRFSQYLKQFSKQSQFIVITHRKGTMEEADVLYGVTMQESGVSKLVSVRLDEVSVVG